MSLSLIKLVYFRQFGNVNSIQRLVCRLPCPGGHKKLAKPSYDGFVGWEWFPARFQQPKRAGDLKMKNYAEFVSTDILNVISDICVHLGDGWTIDAHPPFPLFKGYVRLISDAEKNKKFSMYCYVMNGRLNIMGCAFDDIPYLHHSELPGNRYSFLLDKGALQLAKSVIRKVISEKNYLLSIVNKRTYTE